MNATLGARSADVTVVGGGAVGTCVAFELARRGASVMLLERGPELAWGCSAGNAGIVGASHVVPLANPTALRDGIRWMARSDSPFYVRPHPRILPWLLRFALAATPGRTRRHAAVLAELASRSAGLHARLAAGGLDAGYEQRGMLNLYGSERAFEAALDEFSGNGRPPRVVTDSLPAGLAPVVGAILEPDEAHCDPQRFVQAMGRLAVDTGVDVRTGVEVLEVRRRGSRIDSLWTTAGVLPVGEIVLAAGTWTAGLTRGLGVRLPLEGGKGYHVDVEAREGDPELPVWLHESRVVITPFDGRLRLAGTLELTGTDDRVDARRVEAILAAVRRAMPEFGQRRTLNVWRGLRPCTPDGLPVIGRIDDVANAIVAAGHGMWGLQLAPLTGQLVSAIAAGDERDRELQPLRPGRFSRRRANRGAAGDRTP
jgi:D-amino-acid dehydrogenase